MEIPNASVAPLPDLERSCRIQLCVVHRTRRCSLCSLLPCISYVDSRKCRRLTGLEHEYPNWLRSKRSSFVCQNPIGSLK
jgi:hypothetical protein